MWTRWSFDLVRSLLAAVTTRLSAQPRRGGLRPAVAKRSRLEPTPYLATLRGPALATMHLRAVSPRCQLFRGKIGVACNRRLCAMWRLVAHVDRHLALRTEKNGSAPLAIRLFVIFRE